MAGLGKIGKIFNSVEKVSLATKSSERNSEGAPEFENGLETVKMGNFVTWGKNWFRSGSKIDLKIDF